MSYWIDEPRKANIEHFQEIWRNGSFVAYEWRGTIEMVMNGYSIGKLMGGRSVLERKYKNNFSKWIQDLREKDDEKTWRTRENCKEALETCDFIDDLWINSGFELLQ